MTVRIHVADEHAQLLALWRATGAHGLALCHVDSHCDMRGLLVDRRRRRAWPLAAAGASPDSGNFLTHAVLEGRVRSVRWVHDARAGRRWDVGTVKLESDLSALPRRLSRRLRGERGIPFDLEELTLDRWTGPRPGEHLDLDWDALASPRWSRARAESLIDAFLDSDLAAVETVYLAYSPGYSLPDRGLFARFLERLAERLGAEVATCPPLAAAGAVEQVRRRRTLRGRIELALKGLGIY